MALPVTAVNIYSGRIKYKLPKIIQITQKFNPPLAIRNQKKKE